MINTASEMSAEHVNNFTLMLMMTTNEYGECGYYRKARQFTAMDSSDAEKLMLILEHERTDFIYTEAIDLIETVTGCEDFKLDEVDADDCDEGRDYHHMLECQIVDTELLVIYSNRADEIVIKTIWGGDHICAYTHDETEPNQTHPFVR